MYTTSCNKNSRIGKYKDDANFCISKGIHICTNYLRISSILSPPDSSILFFVVYSLSTICDLQWYLTHQISFKNIFIYFWVPRIEPPKKKLRLHNKLAICLLTSIQFKSFRVPLSIIFRIKQQDYFFKERFFVGVVVESYLMEKINI